MGFGMKRFVEGENRFQSTLFPEVLDDYISDENDVKVIETFIDELNLSGLGFHDVEPQATGRSSYHPATLLKIYIGYQTSSVLASHFLRSQSREISGSESL